MNSPANLFDLTGKVAIVTGSTKGIGRTMAAGLAAAGASVVISSRKRDTVRHRCRRDHGGGSIVNIATMAAYSGGSAVCAYGSSKAGLVNLTKSMAMEWAPSKIRVNVLSPGPFMTEMMEGGARTSPGFYDLVAGGTFQKRIADTDEIVGPVLYLACDASSFVTGDDISVSGGMMK